MQSKSLQITINKTLKENNLLNNNFFKYFIKIRARHFDKNELFLSFIVSFQSFAYKVGTMSSPQVHIQDFVHSILPLHFTYSTSTHLTNLLNHDFLQKLYFNKCILQKLYDTPFFNKQSVFGSVYDFSNLSLHYIRLTLCLLIIPYISLTMPKIIECNGLITTS